MKKKETIKKIIKTGLIVIVLPFFTDIIAKLIFMTDVDYYQKQHQKYVKLQQYVEKLENVDKYTFYSAIDEIEEDEVKIVIRTNEIIIYINEYEENTLKIVMDENYKISSSSNPLEDYKSASPKEYIEENNKHKRVARITIYLFIGVMFGLLEIGYITSLISISKKEKEENKEKKE